MNTKTMVLVLTGFIGGLVIGFLAGFFYPESKKATVDPLQDVGLKTCQYNGATYRSGEGFPSDDNCNSCSCDNGQIVCTTIACESN